MESSASSLSPLSDSFISAFEQKEEHPHGRTIAVNAVIVKVASWFEKLRNAMEYREEEVILRAAIERILHRRLLLGGNAKTTAQPLVRELIWAGYLSNNSVTEQTVSEVEKSIDLYLRLRIEVLSQYRLSDGEMNEWTYHLMSSHIERLLNPEKEKELMCNFMYRILQDDVTITDDSEETRDAQVFLAIRKAFARDDTAFLRYHMFHQYFGQLSEKTLPFITEHFIEGYKEIVRQLTYPRKESIYSYVKNRSAAFFILEDVLRAHKGKIKAFFQNEEEFKNAVYAACEVRYSKISSKVQRAIIRSVVFILFTKVIFAFAVEGTYERLRYGHVLWTSILINTGIPPILMLIVGMFIRTPGKNNSERILAYIHSILYDNKPRLGDPLIISKKDKESKSFLTTIFSVLWLLAFVISFGAIVFVLTKIQFNIMSQFIFIFFVAIVSFLSYRISLTANLYTVGERQGVLTPIVDFFFMPVIRVGRHLTEGISQINFLLFIFDMFIEAPFKALFAFFEQWFYFLHAKREELG
jgi:hypothetical protein